MRTSLHNLQIIEEAVLNQQPEQKLLLSAKVHLDPSLQSQIHWQNLAYTAIKNYGRERLKKDIQVVEHELFNEPEHLSFKQHILSFFKF